MPGAPKTLPAPTMRERAEAAIAARALQAAIADPSTMGEQRVLHIDYSRRRAEWVTTWTNLPGFSRVNGEYHHRYLPGWKYARHEIVAEMIPDLDLLAERGVRPTEATNTRAA